MGLFKLWINEVCATWVFKEGGPRFLIPDPSLIIEIHQFKQYARRRCEKTTRQGG